MRTTAGCLLEIDATTPTDAVLSVAVAAAPAHEALVAGDGLPVRELRAAHGTRLHLLTLPAGRTVVRYDVQVDGSGPPRPVEDLDAVLALRPSRYCPSDLMAPLVLGELDRSTLPAEVAAWVRGRLQYDGAASRPVDSALDTLLTGRGVCRDFAHLLVTALRVLDVPARLVSAYAPGLSPMDFHAVAEVAVDGRWEVFDATGLAPRASLLRIATGQDAADTAFLTTSGAPVDLVRTEVWASTDEPLPLDAPSCLA
jgi:transglutaminase-like putative cysteine protease